MKRHLTKILLIIATLVFTIDAGASDRWETLRAINWVENPTNQTRVGRFGELGPYQFRPSTWQMHTSKPFSLATNRQVADEVAVIHYEWIKRTFERAGVDANAFNIALAWNCGVEAVLSGRVPAVSYGYAERVVNLVDTLKERTRSLADEAPQATPRQFDLRDNAVYFRVPSSAPRILVVAG